LRALFAASARVSQVLYQRN